jgi:diguanylate cyclase (GGDEF)-like protein/PAS domain S-box-containing protein
MDINILKQRAKAFDYLFDAVVVTDMHGIMIDWNKGSEALYGYTKEEAVGQSVSILHVPEDTEHITAEVISAVEKSGKWSGEVRMLHKDGHIGWIESMCVPIYDDDNTMIGALGINRDITDRITEAQRLSRLAHYDQLTEIPNRYLLLERIDHLIVQCERNANSFALLYIDLDKFKIINDTKGHAFGDKLLKEAVSRLSGCVRHSDTIARIGGDEFVVLLENISSTDAIAAMAETLIDALSEEFVIEDEAFLVSCSIGISIYKENGRTTDALLSYADMAMYKAKHQGEGRYMF